jgi:hypothetical protein
MTVSPEGWPPEDQPSAMRVTSNGGAVFTLENPSMINDSIAGTTEFGPARMAGQDLRLLEVERFNVPKSVGFVAMNALVVAGFIALIIKVQPHYEGF